MLRRFSPLALSCLLFACAPPPVIVHSGNPPSGLVVSGSGEAKGAPDIARVTLGVEVRDENSQQASLLVAQRMNVVIAALKGAGVADADIQTASLSMYFERERPPEPRALPPTPEDPAPHKPEPTGVYRASNTVHAIIRDLDRASAVVSAATSAGANQMHGMQFELEDPSGLLDQARAAAVADAKRNAEQLARLTGVTLGRLLSIRESGQGGPVGPMMARAEMASGGGMPVERGTLTVRQDVELIYDLP